MLRNAIGPMVQPKGRYIMQLKGDQLFTAAASTFNEAHGAANEESVVRKMAMGLMQLNNGTKLALKQILEELEALKAKVK
jgi:hypothetical protein